MGTFFYIMEAIVSCTVSWDNWPTFLERVAGWSWLKACHDIQGSDEKQRAIVENHLHKDDVEESIYVSVRVCVLCSSAQFNWSVVSDSLQPHELKHARPPCSSPTPGVYSSSCPSSQWCHPAISSSVVPFSSCPQSLPASESFPMSQLFTWVGQSTGVSALASFLPKNTQGWSPSEWTGWIFLQSRGLSRVFSNTTVQMHQFFGSQPSSQSNSHIHTWLLEKQ